MSSTLVIRERFSVGDRTFAVLAEPVYDAATAEWKARLLFVPLDRSLDRSVSTIPPNADRHRDELLQSLKGLSDRDLARAFRGIKLPNPRAC